MKTINDNTRLYWRAEFAGKMLDEMEGECITPITKEWIDNYCQWYMDLATKSFDARQLEFGVMGMVVKRRLRRGTITSVMNYLEMVEDVFSSPVLDPAVRDH